MTRKNVMPFCLALCSAFSIICLLTLFPGEIQAQNNTLKEDNLQSSEKIENLSPLTIYRAALATSIMDREPQGIANKFPGDIEKIYFFTHVQGALNPTVIYHRWYYKGKLMAEVGLPVKSKNWRTYSSKRIIFEWIGNWVVEAVDTKGQVLKSLTFEIE